MITEKTSIKKWGTGLCIPVLKNTRDILGLEAGTEVQIDVDENGIHVRKVEDTALFPFSEKEIIADCAPAGFHDDLLAENSLSDEELGI